MTHDHTPLAMPGADAGLLSHLWAGIKRGLSRLNSTDTHRQAVRVSNKALRAAQARRIAKQPGLTDEQRANALRMLGRVGGGK